MDQKTRLVHRLCSVCIALGLLLTQGCNYFHPTIASSTYRPAAVREDMRPINAGESFQPTPVIQDYLGFYDLDIPEAEHWFGTVETDTATLATHLFLPPDAKGTLVLLHGYFDHSGILKNLIEAGVEKGYAILVYDLPGHGLSSGAPTAIGPIPECAEQLDTLLDKMDAHCPPPLHAIAHSTGCTILMEYFHQERAGHDFETICFLAPLIHHAHWGWSKFGYTISRPFTKKIRRRVTINSSDPAFLAFVETDPLQSPILSYDFLDSIFDWNKAAAKYPQWPGTIRVIQGDQDSIVDWDYNMKFLGREIADPRIIMIDGANHQLLNETPELRTHVLDLIFEQIEKIEE